MTPAVDLGDLRDRLEELGFTNLQTRILLALLLHGTADSTQMAHHAGVGRTSIYRVMDGLTSRGLVEPVPTHGPITWTTPGWKTVLDTLDAAAEEHLRQHHHRTRQLRTITANLATPKPATTTGLSRHSQASVECSGRVGDGWRIRPHPVARG